jgi:tetratricopeptide (TPR) repeat protein
VLLAAVATALWSSSDALREISWKDARRAAARANELRREASADRRAGHAAEAERLTGEAWDPHVLADKRFATAVRTPGYFLSRALAHCGWIEESALAGEKQKALELAKQFCEVMPDSPQALRYLAEAHYRCKEHLEALEALVRSGRLDPYTEELYDLLPRMFPRDPEADARLIAELVGNLGLTDAEAAILRSAAAARRGDWPGAAAACQGIDPAKASFIAADYWRGRMLLRAGRAREAVAALGRHLADAPIHANGYWLLAQARAQAAGRPGTDAEIEALRRCESLDVEHEPAALRLVEVLAGGGQWDEALRVCLHHLHIARERIGFALAAADIYARQGRPDEAAALLRSELRRCRNGNARLAAKLRELALPGAGRPGGLPEQPGQTGSVRGKVETPPE